MICNKALVVVVIIVLACSTVPRLINVVRAGDVHLMHLLELHYVTVVDRLCKELGDFAYLQSRPLGCRIVYNRLLNAYQDKANNIVLQVEACLISSNKALGGQYVGLYIR